ncbi:MAG TPA: SpoIIE family protein phosphatase [Kiritimatiellia bacterium]|nr:SpoIIE family protein phosphatase [Kiritimatiellia bacterium]
MKDVKFKASLDLRDMGYASILNSLPDGVYITDTNRRIAFWNREAERITGWMAGEVEGKCCRDNILCHVDKDGHRLCGREHCPLHRAMVTGARSDSPRLIFARHRNGNRIPVEVTVSPIIEDDGCVVGGIEVFRDLSPGFQDLNRARLIQQSIMGMQIESDERYQIHVRYTPHDLVGGDFYCVEQINENWCAIMLADVIGHGIPAALYTMQLRSLWEAGREHLAFPDVFLAWLSRQLESLTDTSAGYFATAVYAIYEPATGKLITGLAGHPPPLVISKDNSISTLPGSGPGLGLIKNPEFNLSTTNIEKGDQVLFFSDGALEVCNAAGEELDQDGLIAFIRQTQAKEGGSINLAGIEEKLLGYSNGLSLPDDLTLIQLQRLI